MNFMSFLQHASVIGDPSNSSIGIVVCCGLWVLAPVVADGITKCSGVGGVG